jgi:hypothetical protein
VYSVVKGPEICGTVGEYHRGDHRRTDFSLPDEPTGGRVHCMHSAIAAAKEDPATRQGWRGHDVGHPFVDPAACKHPPGLSVREVKANQLILQRDRIEAVTVADDVRHDAGAGPMLPSDLSRGLFERIDVSDPTRVPIVAPEHDQVVGGNRVAVKLGPFAAILEGVVRPSCLACAPIDRVDNSITGADEYEVARDRG